MKKFQSNSLKTLALSASAIAFVVAGPVWAQAAEEQPEEEPEEEQVDVTTGETPEAEAKPTNITVTGSRIVKDTYSSISPLQVLSTSELQAVGAFDPTQILQRDPAAAGTQIDATFQGFVLNNGPGSTTLDLRGLGADRTLLLINGRRFAPAGVEGAPSNPSINLLPSSLIERYDLLLDGASSVYGSDAVAGVGNIILRKDFDGLELYGRGEINPMGSGEDWTVSAAWGFNTDRAIFGIGAEYDYRDEIRFRDRDFFLGCSTNLEITDTGEIRTLGIADDAIIRARNNNTIGAVPDECVQFVGVGALQINGTRAGAIFRQPGAGNFGIPGFSDNLDAFGRDVDRDGDGIRDVDFRFNNLSGQNPDQLFLSKQELFNVMAYGEYTFPGAGNITPFFEANFSRAEVSANNAGAGNLAPVIPANNPFNPCNITAGGFDCRALDNAFNGFTGPPNALPTGTNRQVRPFFSILGDRDNFEVVQEQYRGVLGVKGDLPFIGSSWTFEVAGVYSRSEGRSSRVGIRNDKLAFALGYDPTLPGGIVLDAFNNPVLPGGPCDAANLSNPGNAQPDLVQGCVPVNLFTDSLFGIPSGSFATDAERDYLFDSRDFDTTYEQKIISGFMTGDLFELPGGPVGVVLGAEWREDSINSQPDAVAQQGLLINFFSDEGASGSKWIREAYGEISLPLMAGQPLVEELNVDLAGRITDEEFYGTNFTYSIKGGWRPVAPLLLRFTYGTSFRAPNLRENFLANQTGFLSISDPCAVPDAAYSSITGYNAALDLREQTTLANCRREGRDPTRVGIAPSGLDTDQRQAAEIATGGSLDIDPETSRSITGGFSFEETIGDSFDVSLSATYYDIKLSGSIVEPSSQFIVNDCFLRDDGQRSPFCERIGFDTDAANTRLLVSDIASGFINLNSESVRGMDFNAAFSKEVLIGGEQIDLGINLRANHLIERSTLFIDDVGTQSFDDDAGEFGLPRWTGLAVGTIGWTDWRFTYQIRYVGDVEQDATGIDPFSDAFGNGPDGSPTGFVGNTCTGGGSANGVVAGDGVFCRDVGFADEIFYHTASIRYRTDRFTIVAGVDNIFETAPPRVDGNEVLEIANTAIGNGYDYDGREFFASIRYNF